MCRGSSWPEKYVKGSSRVKRLRKAALEVDTDISHGICPVQKSTFSQAKSEAVCFVGGLAVKTMNSLSVAWGKKNLLKGMKFASTAETSEEMGHSVAEKWVQEIQPSSRMLLFKCLKLTLSSLGCKNPCNC